MPARAPFKTCGSCRTQWYTWEEFVADPQLRLLGLQAIAGVSDVNLLVFQHHCGGSVSLHTTRLRGLLPHHEAANWGTLRGTDECPGYCIELGNFSVCGEQCRNVRDRDLISLVLRLQQERRSLLA